ncbi:hypothetical protein OG792_13100 [Micromonospora sp. NBC_01699]|uniref:Cap15 family cyclic dinucleotide receptor domain-containing protein n=1 Tax=Micromonospora sp. NBC_01699 TaxID=2975984 RepID=UPI002E2F8515|nr:hypothetical protein [Micromonospora sp. NBC_01699]
MRRTLTIRVVTSVAVFVFVAGTWLTNREFNLGWLRFFSAAVLIATLVLTLWDIWLWRLPLIQRIPGVPRCARGTWQGTLTSLWIDPTTRKSPAPKTVYLVIQQTATLVTVKLLTNESRSTSVLANVFEIDGSIVLTYLYFNKPDMRIEHRSRMHHGSAVLDVSGQPVRRLRGRYWTDRDSKGELEFTQQDRRLADDFAEAAEYFR